MADLQADPMQELKEKKIWMLVEAIKEKDGSIRKKPFAANGGATGTDEKHSKTWVTFDEAEKARDNFKERAVAVGFKIPDGYFFEDIDHIDLDNPYVQTHLRRYGSYAEKSYSGNGLHIYGKCDLAKLPTYLKSDRGETPRRCLDKDFYMKNPHNATELYIGGLTNRFALFTGNRINSEPLRDCTQGVLATLDKDMRKKPAKRYSPKRDGSEEAFRIIEALRNQKNGEKFSKLFDEGDISGYRNDDSAADCALCALIAFRTGDNPALIEEIFNQSALVREKWTSRADYREMTIAKGIEVCDGVFHRSVMPCPPFVKFDLFGNPRVSAPLLARYVRDNLIYKMVRDTANGGTLIYVYEGGCYRLHSVDMLKGIIKGYIAEYDEELVSMRVVSESANMLLTDLQTIPNTALNQDEEYINFANGLLNLETLELEPHTPKILSTIQIPCDWAGTQTATPVFDKYIGTLTDNNKGVENLILEFIGAVLSNVPGWRMKKALFLCGPGDTGKSQLKTLAERLLGTGNFVGIDLKEIEARFGTSAIYGKRLAGSSDMSFVTLSELKTFKKCTGGDSLFAEFKGQNGFEFTYGGLLWFCMNRLPKFGGDDGQWVYNRIMQIDCPNVIPKEKQNKRLIEKMYAEREGIVYKAVMAFRNVVRNGYRFTEPREVEEARANYRNMNSTVISFFQECMEERPGGVICDNCTTSRIYKVYRAWCGDNNNGFAKTAREFRDELADHLGETYSEMLAHGKSGNFYRGYTLTDEAKREYSREYGCYAETDFL